jgi:small-conductance mechanosensitive channel
LRKFILIILLSIVGLIVLSTIGIDIKPLLAGAGVIGLAFGLGTQSLIKDIVSGMFFLMDDAFRIGDYVETGKIKGTVESIHIRSLKLRHPRGMIHTVPFSQLGSVTNFSRGYLVSKIEFRVPYGTDINKVKKLVKKINEGVEQDKDLGPNLLSPIKSIGVKGFDDSGLIMAVKFSSKPSRQSELQRYVLQGLQESFGKHGLVFAHRHVVVRFPEGAAAEKHDTSVMPPVGPTQPPPKEILSAGAAAAITVALAEDETKKK